MALRIDPENLAGAMTRSAQPRVDANDFRQFAELRRGAQAHDPKVLREAARQFESLFTKMMLKSMREASFGDPLFGSDQADMYQDMADDQLAVQMSQGRGLGLADMLIRQLSGGAAVGAAASPDATSSSVSGDAPTAEQRGKFVSDLMPHATAAARELGIDPNHLIAQAALETGWGRAQSGRDSHNLFGIKAGTAWQGASVQQNTTEFESGVPHEVSARFRSYESPRESVDDYVRLLRDNPRYAAALNTGGDVHAFATALQRGGYATDPDYAAKLVAVAAQVAERVNGDSFKSASNPPIAAQEPSRNSNG